MSRHRKPVNRRPAQVVLVILLVGLVCAAMDGIARAYWSGFGIGSGSAPTGTTVSVTLRPGTPIASLYPGGNSDVVTILSNANTVPVRIGSLLLDTGQGAGGFAVDPAHSACSLSSLSFTAPPNTGMGWTIPAKISGVDGTVPVTLIDAVAMSVDGANACQGATFTVYLMAGS